MLSSCLGLSEGVCVCMRMRGWFFGGRFGRGEWQLSAGGSCHWKSPPPCLSSLPGRRAAPMVRVEIESSKKALTQRNATLSDGGCPTITQHIFTAYWIVQDSGWSGKKEEEEERGWWWVAVGRRHLKLFLDVFLVLFLSFFVMATLLVSRPALLDFLLPEPSLYVFSVTVDV